jgi:hypothetical protein
LHFFAATCLLAIAAQICTKNKEPFLRKLHNSIMEKCFDFFPSHSVSSLGSRTNEMKIPMEQSTMKLRKRNIIKCIIKFFFCANNLSCQSIFHLLCTDISNAFLSVLAVTRCVLSRDDDDWKWKINNIFFKVLAQVQKILMTHRLLEFSEIQNSNEALRVLAQFEL